MSGPDVYFVRGEPFTSVTHDRTRPTNDRHTWQGETGATSSCGRVPTDPDGGREESVEEGVTLSTPLSSNRSVQNPSLGRLTKSRDAGSRSYTPWTGRLPCPECRTSVLPWNDDLRREKPHIPRFPFLPGPPSGRLGPFVFDPTGIALKYRNRRRSSPARGFVLGDLTHGSGWETTRRW